MVRIFGYYVSRVYFLLGVGEAILFFLSMLLGNGLRERFMGPIPDEPASSIWLTALVFALVMSAATIAMGLYQRGVQEQAAGFIVRLGFAFVLGTLPLALIFYAFPATFVGRGVLGFSLFLALLAILVTRALFTRLVKAESRKRRVLVLGTGVNAHRIQQLTPANGGDGFLVVGYVPLGDLVHLIDAYQQTPKSPSLLDLAIEREVDEIVVAVDDRRRKLPVDEILDCKMSGFPVLDLLTFFEKETSCIKIDLLHPSWIFFSSGFHISLVGNYGKRLLDLTASLFLLTLAAPLMLLVAVASLIESGGRAPVLYQQVRVGENGKPFRLYKFRSMRVDAEADGVARWATQRDPRVTRLGAVLRKTRLDELPQLFSVLRGHMSLVGPRPERPEFVEQLSRVIPFYTERHRVKPGVTGWAQMLYPYGASVEDAKRKLEYDLYYVKNAGVMLDLIILLQTVEIVLLGKGAR